VAQAEAEQPLAPGCAAVGIGVNDQLRPRPQGLVAGGVHVAEDDVRLPTLLEQRVGAAVDADQHGIDVADVSAQRLQVTPVGGAADDDQNVAIAEAGARGGELDAASEQLALLPQMGNRVLGERRQRLVDLSPLLLQALGQLVGLEHPSHRDLVAAAQQPPPVDHQRVPVAQTIEEGSAGSVEQAYPGADQQQRTRVGIAPV
jgi:hypothetical protein